MHLILDVWATGRHRGVAMEVAEEGQQAAHIVSLILQGLVPGFRDWPSRGCRIGLGGL